MDPEYLNSNYSLKAVAPSGKQEPFSSGYKDKDNAGLGEYELQYSQKKDGTGSYDLSFANLELFKNLSEQGQ